MTLFLTSLLLISTIIPSFTSVKVLADEKYSINSGYTLEEQKEIAEISAALEDMFSNGVSEKNFKQYAQKNFSEQELITADSEMNTSLSRAARMNKFDWNSLGRCMANKIKDELLAMISIGTIVKYAQKKAWSELAKIVVKYIAKAGVKTNAILIAGQLAIWGLQCGINF